MFSFCPHCGGAIGQEQVEGQMLVCRHCGKQIGVVATPRKEMVDQADDLIRRGQAARCPLCQQLVEVRKGGMAQTFVPHFATSPQRKICPNSGKQVAAVPPSAPSPPVQTPPVKDLSAFMTKDCIRVVSCQRAADPRIEELTLEYLDKSDRVRLQIEALRDILGPDFRMKDYPPSLGRPHLAVWGNATSCVVARKHGQGGFEPMTGAEVTQIVADLRQHRQLFFP